MAYPNQYLSERYAVPRQERRQPSAGDRRQEMIARLLEAGGAFAPAIGAGIGAATGNPALGMGIGQAVGGGMQGLGSMVGMGPREKMMDEERRRQQYMMLLQGLR